MWKRTIWLVVSLLIWWLAWYVVHVSIHCVICFSHNLSQSKKSQSMQLRDSFCHHIMNLIIIRELHQHFISIHSVDSFNSFYIVFWAIVSAVFMMYRRQPAPSPPLSFYTDCWNCWELRDAFGDYVLFLLRNHCCDGGRGNQRLTSRFHIAQLILNLILVFVISLFWKQERGE